MLIFFEVQSNAQYKVPEVKSQPIKPFEDVEYKVSFKVLYPTIKLLYG